MQTVNFGTRDGTTTSTNTNIISNQGVSDNSTLNNISYILEQVNSSRHSTEEKEEIKNILEELNKELAPNLFQVYLKV
jgi:hypothetical protein